MHRREYSFVCILLLTAVLVSCSTPDLPGAANNLSTAETKDKPASTDAQPVAAWPPPAAEPSIPRPSAPPLPTKIVTKDPEYRGLIKPPSGDEFLKLYSTQYKAKMAEVEASVATLSDVALREKARLDGWKNVDKAGFQKQAVEAHATKLREYMAKRPDGWIEIGHCEYDPTTKVFKIYSIPASPFQGTNKFETHMDIATIDAVYNKFRPLADARIKARIDQDVVEYFATEASPVYSREQVTDFLRVRKYKAYESSIRQEQMVVIGRGNLADKSIEQVSIVDYATETVLLELDPTVFRASNPTWLY